jgi:hypothetical protein
MPRAAPSAASSRSNAFFLGRSRHAMPTSRSSTPRPSGASSPQSSKAHSWSAPAKIPSFRCPLSMANQHWQRVRQASKSSPVQPWRLSTLLNRSHLLSGDIVDFAFWLCNRPPRGESTSPDESLGKRCPTPGRLLEIRLRAPIALLIANCTALEATSSRECIRAVRHFSLAPKNAPTILRPAHSCESTEHGATRAMPPIRQHANPSSRKLPSPPPQLQQMNSISSSGIAMPSEHGNPATRRHQSLLCSPGEGKRSSSIARASNH